MLNNPFVFHCIALHEAEQSRSVWWLLLGTGAKAALEKAKSPTEEPMLTFNSTKKKKKKAVQGERIVSGRIYQIA